MRARAATVGMVAVLTLAGMIPARADGVSLDDLRGRIAKLGYDVGSLGSLLRIKVDSTYSYPIYFSLNPAADQLTIFAVLEDVGAEQLANLPATQILQFNDRHFDYLSLNERKGGLRFVIQTALPPSAATDERLKATIGRLVADADASESLWNPTRWSANAAR